MKFSMHVFVMRKTLVMCTNKICFHGEIWKLSMVLEVPYLELSLNISSVNILEIRTAKVYILRGKRKYIRFECSYFCVTCIAWQTHRDHVVCLHRQQCHLHCRCCRHTFCFCSITFEGMHWFYSKSAVVYIIVKYRSSWILVIICQILAELWPFFNWIL